MAEDELELFAPQARGDVPRPGRADASATGRPEAGPHTGSAPQRDAPLAERMRPRSLDELVGQPALTAPGSALRAWTEARNVPSLVLWGPPGSGKTTLARLLAGAAGMRIAEQSAVVAGVKEIRGAVERARRERAAGARTLLFIDEIHRLNRAQQDVLLPHVEAGSVVLVGATTENPSFEVNAPLLSRCRVLLLEPLAPDAIAALLERAMHDPERGLGASGVALSDEARDAIASGCDGDARRALNLLEAALAVHVRSDTGGPLALESVRLAAGHEARRYDRDRDAHYDLASALIKSIRSSDPDAALYYLARMLDGGEDPLFLARRLVIAASEDVGNADPQALPLALAAYQAVERIGMPEGRIPLAQATTWLACAPKSDASHAGLGRAQQAVAAHGSLPVPLHLRNAPTALMRAHGHGRGYVHAHDAPDGFVAARNLPDALGPARFYEPRAAGAEQEIASRLAKWRRLRAQAAQPAVDVPGEERAARPAARGVDDAPER